MRRVFRSEDLAALLGTVAERVRVPAGQVAILVSAYEADAIERERERKARLIQAKAAVRRLTELRTKLYTDKLEGVVDEARWGEIDRGYQLQEADAQSEVERWSKVAEESPGRAARVLELLGRLPELYTEASDSRRAELLRALGWNYILKGGSVEPVYKEPFEAVANAVASGDWRSVVDKVRTAVEAEELIAVG